MPRSTTITADEGAWTELTANNITDITFQVKGGGTVLVQATVGAVAPIVDTDAISYKLGQGEANRALADLFPGVSGANRVYAKALSNDLSVFVSHA